MNKLKMESVDITEQNIDRIAELFPQVVTEVADPSGAKNGDGTPRLRKAIDFEKLKLVLSAGTGDYVVADDDRERYEFTWVGKRQSMIDAAKPIRKTLRPCPEESKNWNSTENLYIEGDNLEVLKLLQESYLGKVKMIYIDPPYNTGNDFVYRDNFSKSREDYEGELDMFDEEGNKLFQNTETNGRFHSDWCSMIYPRLQLARNLLTDDGVIFISIDDNEVENLKKICDEVFGASNFVAQFNWKRKKEISSDSKNVAIQGEYILAYAKSVLTNIYPESLSKDYIENSYNEPNEIFSQGKWRPVPLTVSKGLSGGGYSYTIKTPTGKEHRKLWAYPENSYKELLNANLVYFGKDNNGIPQRVIYAHESKGQPVSNYWDNVATNKEGKKNILGVFGDNIFDTPKPIALIIKMINLCVDKKDIILDFFSGSATTAHAVMQLNAEDGGNRKFIMVQLPEKTDEKSEAYKAGYKNICEIGKERIRRAGEKIKEDNKGKEGIEKLDTGFRVLKSDTTNMKDVYYSAGELSQSDLFDTVSNIKDDRSDIDLLYGCLLDWGVELSMPHSTEKIEEYTVHTVDSPLTDEIDLVACFDSKVSESVIRTIAERKPTRAVFRDASFADSANKINVFEIFKSISPDTTVKVI